jgi:Protein of unknown function (DUF3987)
LNQKLFDDWQLWMKNMRSPQNFVDLSFYYMIGAALQRRVWTGPVQSPLFPNMYVILCGRPGVGKGLVIKQVAEFLKYHKKGAQKSSPQATQAKFDMLINEARIKGLDLSIIENLEHGKNALAAIDEASEQRKEPERLLIPVGADSTTYQKLVETNARQVSTIAVKPCEMAPAGTYTHHSLCFCLEEMSSLFRRKTEDIVNFLIVAFDCGDYDYEIITRQPDRIKKTCLSFFAGTTPSFMQDAFDEKLVSEGFGARTIYAYGDKNRNERYEIPEFTEDQKLAKQRILKRILELSTLFGPVKLAPDALEFYEHYFQKILPFGRENDSPKLDAYYARKNIHVTKIAMAMHFADSNEMTMSLETCERALKFLNELEAGMHQALSFSGKNPLAPVAKRIMEFIRKSTYTPDGTKNKEGVTLVKIYGRFFDDVTGQQLQEILTYLIDTQKLEVRSVGNQVRYFIHNDILGDNK